VPEKEPEDEILAKREFQRAAGVDLGDFMIAALPSESEEEEVISEEEKEEDVAVGEVAEIFTRGDAPSEINRDGTVDAEPEMDTITEYAVEGEKRIHIGLMIAMIVTWSAIGAIVGTTLGHTLSAIGLLAMAGFGLFLGEIWIKDKRMHLLGVTWVIISMKLLYGLAISMEGWGWIDPTLLGIILLTLVGINILIAQRHDEDAIAAQATLVLLVTGSAAGALYGQMGVAIMVGIGTLMFHSLAFLRKSGNLASLGIAVSYLWIGIHSISNDWLVFGIHLVPFEDPLLLFLLMFGVTGINALVAAVFAKEENWFSSAFEALKLGKPGLWSVSVGLGMIGALLAIAAHRHETGYALAQLILLIYAFAPSYLVVRGVDWGVLQRYTLWPAPFLLVGLVLIAQGVTPLPVDEPWSIFAALSAAITVFTLLSNESAVSDHVLWMGGIVVVILLTILIPAGESEIDGARGLLLGQIVVWGGMAWLSLQRNSPSLAGTAVLAPWIWLMIFASDFEDRLVSMDVIPVVLPQMEVGLYMVGLVAFAIPINLKLGDTGVNLASRLIGMSELSARLRDSGMMRLWNIGFLMSLTTILFITRQGAIEASSLIILMGLLLVSHSIIMRMDRHQGTPRLILLSWGIAAVILQWKFGFAAIWIAILGLCSLIIVRWSEENAQRYEAGEGISTEALMPGKLVTITLSLMAVIAIIISLDKHINYPLDNYDLFPIGNDELRLATLAVLGTIGFLYLPRASSFDKLLPPAMAAIATLIALGLAASTLEDMLTLYAVIIGFVVTGAWLAAQGEIRSRMKQVTIREERIAQADEKRAVKEYMESTQAVLDNDGDGARIKMYDADLIERAQKMKKKSKRTGQISELDVVTGDIHHKPTIVLSFISVTILVGIFLAWSTRSGVMAIALASFISILFIGIARWRANEVGLHLPDMMGIESPVAITMAGLTLIHVASRVGDVSSKLEDQTGLAVLIGALTLLACLSLLGRKDLGLRIPSALEGVLILLLVSRILTSLMGLDQLRVDPTHSDIFSWVYPVWGLELFLLVSVLLYEWVENERLKRDLTDHRGAAGRAAWAALISLLSFGPVGILACLLVMKNGLKWTQPAVPVTTSVLLVFSWFTFSQWYEQLEETASIFAIVIGIGGLAWASYSTVAKKGLWIPAGLWIGHLLLPMSSFTFFEAATPSLVVALLLCSTTSWMIGVLTLRRAWRIIGALDLVIAWMVAGKLLISGASSSMALIMLLATAILLGLVTWIGQVYEDEISRT